jgi:hypothetical protein
MIRVFFKSPNKPKRQQKPVHEFHIVRHEDGRRWRIMERGRVSCLPGGLAIFPSERAARAMLKSEFTVPGLFEVEEPT